MFKKLILLVGLLMASAAAAVAQGDSSKPVAASSTDAKLAAAASETKPARFTPNKDQIMQGQKFLKEGKLYSGEATGVYNEETRASIRKYQKENSLTVSGNFNSATLEKMGIALTDKQKGVTANTASTAASDSTPAKAATIKTASSSSSTPSTDGPKRPAPFQANKDQIMSLQKTLKEAKLFTGEANGERSDELKEAVKKYQSSNGLKVTGGINADTLTKAGIALTETQKANVRAQSAFDAAKPKDQ